MILKRLIVDVSWLLDDRYEIELCPGGHTLKIRDTKVLVKIIDHFGKEKMIPQEHVYYDGEGLNSLVRGLHNFPRK